MFLKTVGSLSGLRDPNLARVLALCSLEEPLCAVSEAGERGDLWTFLRGKETVTPGRRRRRSTRNATNRRSRSHYSNLEDEEANLENGGEDDEEGSMLRADLDQNGTIR